MFSERNINRTIRAFLKRADIAVGREELAVELLAGGGSDRRYYRVKTPAGSYVVMTALDFRQDIRDSVEVGRFLWGHGIGVPEIIFHDDEKQLVLLEDLGDQSLYRLVQGAETRQTVTAYYKMVLPVLAEMQMKVAPHLEQCNCLKHSHFGFEALRWETDYFLECFLKLYCGMDMEKEGELEDECNALATILAAEPRYFMHRDFQSQNIYFKNGRVRIIDFQTGKHGLLQYDLAALLKDAYVVLNRQQRDELLQVYIDVLADTWDLPVDRPRFVEVFHLVGLQRNMQALGAFAFLSMSKGKKEFLRHIPAALSSLNDGLAMFDRFPCLTATAKQATQTLP